MQWYSQRLHTCPVATNLVEDGDVQSTDLIEDGDVTAEPAATHLAEDVM